MKCEDDHKVEEYLQWVAVHKTGIAPRAKNTKSLRITN